MIQLTKTLPSHGVGAKVRRRAWKGGDCYWTITKVKPSLVCPASSEHGPELLPHTHSIVAALQDGLNGTVNGVFTWRGVQKSPKPTRVNGYAKKHLGWRLLEDQQGLQWQQTPKPSTGSMTQTAAAGEAGATVKDSTDGASQAAAAV